MFTAVKTIISLGFLIGVFGAGIWTGYKVRPVADSVKQALDAKHDVQTLGGLF